MVREAKLEDAAAIARVHVASWQEAYRELIPAARLAAFTVAARTAAWRRNLSSPSGIRTTVFDDGDGGIGRGIPDALTGAPGGEIAGDGIDDATEGSPNGELGSALTGLGAPGTPDRDAAQRAVGAGDDVARGQGILGFASIGRSRDLAGWGEIWAIYVAPEAWGRGVGSALFADAIAALAAAGLTRVMLWVLEGNTRALHFYQGSGFVLDGTHKVEDGLSQLRLRRVR